MNPPRLLNFGCGAAFHPAWVNLDAAPVSVGVVAHDLRRGFPYPEDFFDAVYGSHVLEHLEPDTARLVLNECFRILRPGGIVRIVVPDLETIAKLYLQFLEGALKGDPESSRRYDWIMLELYDQVARTKSAGNMGVYLRSRLEKPHAQFVSCRVGDEALGQLAIRGQELGAMPVRRRLQSRWLAIRTLLAQACAFALLGREGRTALTEGIFRRSGEVHHWMYDRFSLIRILQQAGFTSLRVCLADESAIPAFASYGLETMKGQARKPDSLYVEGRKPG